MVQFDPFEAEMIFSQFPVSGSKISPEFGHSVSVTALPHWQVTYFLQDPGCGFFPDMMKVRRDTPMLKVFIRPSSFYSAMTFHDVSLGLSVARPFKRLPRSTFTRFPPLFLSGALEMRMASPGNLVILVAIGN